MSVLYSLASRYGRRKPLLAGAYFHHTSWIDRFYSKLHETKMAELNKDKATEYISPGIKSNIKFNF